MCSNKYYCLLKKRYSIGMRVDDKLIDDFFASSIVITISHWNMRRIINISNRNTCNNQEKINSNAIMIHKL